MNTSSPVFLITSTSSTTLFYYTVRNKTNKRMLAKANPSVTPGPAVSYVKNTQCFCFATQVFEAGETRHLEVQLVVDPALPVRYKRLTFGLTFYDTTNK